MWSPVLFVLLVASVRANAGADPAADADADAEPFLPYVYPQYNYGNSWAATHFGTPQENLELKDIPLGFDAAYRPSFGFLPAAMAPSSFLAIRDVQAPPASILQLQKPVETHDVQLFRHPAMFFGPPLFFQTSHIRVPDHNQKERIPVPVAAAPAYPTFGSQHTAQIPVFFRPPTVHYPIAGPSFGFQHSAQIPVFSNAFTQKTDDEDEEDDDEKQVNIIYVPHFPTELASLTSLRDMNEEPIIPAGIVQSTQPSFKPMVFQNSKVHPDLLSILHDTSGASVLAV